ncbi:CgeB family protein [Propionivibrio limicola]|uniref:CgeB family protein n=1 Tax=Propionivibrio limicola TaxID=167645 RepID=UPI001291C76E|nr:glycosyltransferase [Propionivibrio limicola]
MIPPLPPSTSPFRFLILDGIGGVPLGLELATALQADGHTAIHFDCLKQKTRPFYGIRSACAKLLDKEADKDGFYLLPKLASPTLADLVARTAPTHILVAGFIYKFFDPHELRRIADTCRATLLLYDTDSCNLYGKRREFLFFIENELPVYHRIFSFSQVTTRFFGETRQLPVTHLPFGANPIATPDHAPPSIDTLFVGSGDLRRILLLEAIRKNVTVFGNRWRRNYPLISRELQARIHDTPVWGKELHSLLGQSRIVLNITRTDFYGAETGVNLRIFEAVAAGCFLLTDYCEELEELFEIGHEIEVFRSASELADKVHYYLTHEDKRQAIARQGHERFMREHTWTARARELCSHLSTKFPKD